MTLRMRGACSGCPSSSATLKGGIENMLMHYVPEVCHLPDAKIASTARGKVPLRQHHLSKQPCSRWWWARALARLPSRAE